jgi:hypothetical protein
LTSDTLPLVLALFVLDSHRRLILIDIDTGRSLSFFSVSLWAKHGLVICLIFLSLASPSTLGHSQLKNM